MRLLAVLAIIIVAPGAARAEGLAGEALLENGGPLEGVTLFAIDAGSGEIVAAGRSDPAGHVSLAVGRAGKVLVGASPARYELTRLESASPDHFRAFFRPVSDAPGVLDPAAASAGHQVRVTPAAG